LKEKKTLNIAHLQAHGAGNGAALHSRHEDPEAELASSTHSEAQPVTRQEFGIRLQQQHTRGGEYAKPTARKSSKVFKQKKSAKSLLAKKSAKLTELS
jgi:hypothetical protein